MGAIDRIVDINISQTAASVPTVSTTIPVLLGTTNPGWADDDYIHAYASANDLLSDGFTTKSQEYLAALSLTAQQTVPNEFYVARRSGDATPGEAQIDRITVKDVLPSHIYRFTYDSTVVSYTSGSTDGSPQIIQGLLNAFNQQTALSTIATATTPADSSALILTVSAQGAAHTISAVDSELTLANVQEAEAAQAETLTADDLNNIQAQNDSWYGLILISGTTDADIVTAANWAQSRRKRVFANSTTLAIESAKDTDNIAVKLGASNLSRLALGHFVKGDQTEGVSAWVGEQLPKVPGTNNWFATTLAGTEPDSFSSAAILTMVGNPVAGIKGRNVNIYTSVGGVAITQMGTNIDGSFIDTEIGIDWLFFNLQSSVYQSLVGSPKVAYTDAGVAILVAAVRSVLDTAVGNGLIDGTQSIKISVARVADVSPAVRATRRAPTINFSCVLAGAVNAVQVNGVVSV